jgi:hypothetical protein
MRHHFRRPQAMLNKGSLFYSHCGTTTTTTTTTIVYEEEEHCKELLPRKMKIMAITLCAQ